MKMQKLLTFFISCLFFSAIGYSQCNSGEVEVTMVVSTDGYGYEGYWEIVPTGNGCGNGTIASGGNPMVGCDGYGNQTATSANGYGNNETINVGPWCLIEGTCYDIIFVDDYGDGGFDFVVNVNGFEVGDFTGLTGANQAFTFCASEPAPYDLAVTISNLVGYQSVGAFDLSASIFNEGSAVITSYDFNYSVDGQATQTHSVSGTSLGNSQIEEVDHSIPVNLPSNGNYVIKMWTDNLNNGNVDANNVNDTLTAWIEAGPGVPNFIDDYINTPITVSQIAGSADQVNTPTDLDFHPVLTRKELWICNKETESSGGSTVTIYDAGESAQTTLYKQDGNAWHFMSLPTGIAFSQNGNWANSPGVYDANHNGGDAFTGPSLWSSDMNIYAEPSGGNGSHLDMLHLSPESQGICAENNNVFWLFDGYNGDIVRYDFVEDHGPGNSYHGDAIVRRYSDDAVAKDPANNVVSHLILDGEKKWLYVVDNGNQRVIRIDITTGSDQGGTPQYPMNETIAEYDVYTGYTQETVVTGLQKPAGIDIVEDRMIVSEYQSGEIIIYDISSMPAVELERINTPYSSVQGVKIGPEGRIWFVDQNSNGVYRIEAQGLGIEELSLEFEVYPNPSSGMVNVVLTNSVDGTIEVRDIQGKLIANKLISGQTTQIELDAASGMYFVQIAKDGVKSEMKRIIVEKRN